MNSAVAVAKVRVTASTDAHLTPCLVVPDKLNRARTKDHERPATIYVDKTWAGWWGIILNRADKNAEAGRRGIAPACRRVVGKGPKCSGRPLDRRRGCRRLGITRPAHAAPTGDDDPSPTVSPVAIVGRTASIPWEVLTG